MTENHHKSRLKIIIAFSILFLVVTLLLVLIFSAGKKTYVVTYDLNGGTLISGSVEQHVTQGQNAVPPVVVKDGAYLHSWSASSNHVTKNMTITAIWEYKTTDGIIYSSEENQNYAEIAGAYPYIGGEVYLGAYYGDKKILGICDNAFSGCTQITKVYLLNGLIAIGNNAFSGCTGLAEIEIPKTVTHLGSGAFQGCEALESVVVNEGILKIGAEAFSGCAKLLEITLPSTIESIGENAFAGCGEGLVVKIMLDEADAPEGFAEGWNGDAEIVWLGKPAEDTDAEADGDKNLDENGEILENHNSAAA